MKIFIIVVAVILCLVALVALVKKKVVIVDAKARIADLPAIFSRLQATEQDGNFAALMFTQPGKRSPDEAINLQFSIERSHIGLDWVLLAPTNIRDKERFIKFVSNRGYKVVEREMNQVRYVRVEEGGSLPALCKSVICELYSISPETEMDLIPEGFTWP